MVFMNVETPSAPPMDASIPMTLSQLVAAEEALTRLLEVKLPAKLAYHVAKLARLVTEETRHYHTQREALIRELGVPIPDSPDQIRVEPQHLLEFQTRLMEVGEIETRIAWVPLQLADLPDMTGADAMRLGPLLVDG
jgi:hypothetical protein